MGSPLWRSRVSSRSETMSLRRTFSRRRRSTFVHDELAQLAELVRKRQVARGVIRQKRERRSDSRKVIAEQRQKDDLERGLAHVLGQIDRRAAFRRALPSIGELARGGVDVGHPRGDDLAVERWLHHFALAPPVVAFARHEPVAEQDGHALDADALLEVCVMLTSTWRT
jgi:hypothetical protein